MVTMNYTFCNVPFYTHALKQPTDKKRDTVHNSKVNMPKYLHIVKILVHRQSYPHIKSVEKKYFKCLDINNKIKDLNHLNRTFERNGRATRFQKRCNFYRLLGIKKHIKVIFKRENPFAL